MSEEQLMQWLDSEVDHMEDIVEAIEGGETGVEETAGMVGGLEYEIRQLRRAVMVD